MSYSKSQWNEAGALRAAHQRHNGRRLMVGVVALAVAATLAGCGSSGADKKADGAASTKSAQTYTPTATALAGVNAPQGARSDGGIPIGRSGRAGTDNGADAVEVDVYSDYMCSACSQFDAANAETLKSSRESGEVTEVLHPVAILDRHTSSMYSTRAASAAAYIADRAPDALGAFHDLMFTNQPSGKTDGLSNQEIQAIAEQAGVPAKVAAGIGDGTATVEFGDWVKAATTTAASTDSLKFSYNGEMVFGTPAIMVDGKRLEGDWTQAGALQDAIAAAKK